MMISDLFWLHLLAALIGAGAGSLLFLIFVNRVLGRLRNSRIKPFILLGSLVFFAGGLAWLGYRAGYPQGLALVLAVLAGVVLGETYLQRQRTLTLSDPPLESWYRIPPPKGLWATLSRPVTTTDLVVSRYGVCLPPAGEELKQPAKPQVRQLERSERSWPDPLPFASRQMRIVHLSDMHVNPLLPLSYYEDAIERANTFQPDLVFITGDFVTHTGDIDKLPGLLERVRSRYGTYAILGNHDHWAGPDEIVKVLEQTGIDWIGNGWRRVQAGGLPPLLLAGCEVPWSRKGILPVPERQPDELLFVLSHTADPVFSYSRMGATAMFTGHYHAGQFRLPYLGALIVPSTHGRRFDRGHFQVGPTHLFVSAGMGCAAPAFRLYCPPDFYVVDFELPPSAAAPLPPSVSTVKVARGRSESPQI